MKILLTAVITVLFTSLAITSTAAAYNPLDPVCSGSTANSPSCADRSRSQTPSSNSIYGPDGILTKIAQIVSIIVGIASVIMIIIAGLMFVTSGGDSNRVSTARNTVIYAIVGIVITALAQSIIIFVLNKL